MSLEQLDEIVKLLRANVAIAAPSADAMRSMFEQMMASSPIDASVKCEPANTGVVQSEWVSSPEANPSKAVLYLHGGGYVIGSINTCRALAARISKAAGARVLIIDYGLAPEHPHPAAVADAVASYRWLLHQGFNPSCIAVGGDSAGGGLTIAALVAARDAKMPMPGAAVCLSPWVDLEGIGESMSTRANLDPMVQKEPLIEMAKLYLNGQDPRTPLAAPLYADLSGLPPLLIQVGTSETLFDDSVRLAERARKAGISVELEPWENMIHVWQTFAHVLDEGQQAIDRIGEFIQLQLQA